MTWGLFFKFGSNLRLESRYNFKLFGGPRDLGESGVARSSLNMNIIIIDKCKNTYIIEFTCVLCVIKKKNLTRVFVFTPN